MHAPQAPRCFAWAFGATLQRRAGVVLAPLATAWVAHPNTAKKQAMDADDGDSFDIVDTPEKRALKSRLVELREEHRALDNAIFALQEQSGGDALQLARLKKRKLVLRDQIQWIEDRLTPDIIA